MAGCMNQAETGKPSGDRVWTQGRTTEQERPSLSRRLRAALAAGWRRLVAAREARATLRLLGGLNERQLRDIGLSRRDIEWASQAPSSRDAADELVRRSKARRRRR